MVLSHPSVAVLLYHRQRQAVILVRQFRPAVYISATREAEAAGEPKPPLSGALDLLFMCLVVWLVEWLICGLFVRLVRRSCCLLGAKRTHPGSERCMQPASSNHARLACLPCSDNSSALFTSFRSCFFFL
jgi:hypothetical protein